MADQLPTSMEEHIWAAMLRGDAYVFSCTTAGVSPTVAAGSYLNVVVTNVGTRKAVIFERRFDNTVAYNAASVAYGGIPGPQALTSPTVSYGGTNLNDNFGTSTELSFTAGVYTARLNNSAGNASPSATGQLPVGDVLKLMQPRVLSPNKPFGQFIFGAAAGLGSIQLNLTMYIFLLPTGY